MEINDNKYFLLLDTNILFQRYDKSADFTSFSFGEKYKQVIDIINEFDIYDKVTVLISEVSWKELEKQIVDAYLEKTEKIKEEFENFIFPGMELNVVKEVNYQSYVTERIKNYKSEIQDGINHVMDLPIPENECFSNIITRAFEKRPPFEGKEKKSDKGFKDALIWESVLSFFTDHPNGNLLFFCNDKIFNDVLIEEYKTKFPDAEISFCKDIAEVQETLKKWAISIDKYAYIPIDSLKEYKGFKEWLESGDFTIQLIDGDFGILNQSQFGSSKYVNLVEYGNISETEGKDTIIYTADVVLSVGYYLADGGNINKKVNATITVSYGIDEVYIIEKMKLESENDL